MTARRAEDGFTLVEVLAALVVFGIAALGLSRATSETVRGAGYVEAKFLAETVAENEMADVFMRPEKLRPGTETGIAHQRGRTYNWTRLVTPTTRSDLLNISITVANPDSGQVLASLTALRSKPE